MNRWSRARARARDRHHRPGADVQRGAEHRAHARQVVVAARRRDCRQHEHGWHRRDRRRVPERPRRSRAPSRRMRSSGTSASSRPASRPNGCWRSTPTTSLSDGLSPRDPVAAARCRPCPDSRRRSTTASTGSPLRGAAYPPVTVLYRRARGRYEQDGHTQRVRLDGEVRPLDRAHPARRPQVAQPLARVAGRATWRSKPTSSPDQIADAGRSSIECADGS